LALLRQRYSKSSLASTGVGKTKWLITFDDWIGFAVRRFWGGRSDAARETGVDLIPGETAFVKAVKAI
jgi:hypothetical protein